VYEARDVGSFLIFVALLPAFLVVFVLAVLIVTPFVVVAELLTRLGMRTSHP
jgi:hypothetical protein